MTLTPRKTANQKIEQKSIVTIDIEAYDWTKPIAIGMYHHHADSESERYQVFTGENCVSEFVTEMLRHKWRNHHFFAHYGGRYDFIPIVSELVDRDGYEGQYLTRTSDVFYAKIKREVESENSEREYDKPVHLHDSYALIPLSLDKATSAFAPDQPKGDFDVESLDDWDSMPENQRKEMLEYLKQDCKSLAHVLFSFNKLISDLSDGKTSMQLTLGSTTMAIFRTCFQDRDISPDSKAEPHTRESFFGGRTEVYDMECKPEGGPYYHYDVNSLYPHSYTNFKIPVGQMYRTENGFPLSNNDIGGVVKIRGYVPPESCYGIPVLPVRTNIQGGERVIFPSGEIEGWYNPTEVRYAQSVGAIEDLEVIDGFACEMAKPFEEFGNRLYTKKQEIDPNSEPGMYWIVKLLLNSFFGKFGMEREQSSIVQLDDLSGFVDTIENRELKEISLELTDKGVFEEITESSAKYIIPSISAEITARARIEMHKWFMEVFNEGGNLWYCDTDSLVTDIQLPESDDLGGMDLEGVINEAYFVAPKVYAERYTDDWVEKKGLEEPYEIKAKGMRNLEASFSDFRNAYHNNDPSIISTEWEAPRGFKSGMKNDADNWFTKNQFSRSVKRFDVKRDHSKSISKGANSKPLPISEVGSQE